MAKDLWNYLESFEVMHQHGQFLLSLFDKWMKRFEDRSSPLTPLPLAVPCAAPCFFFLPAPSTRAVACVSVNVS